MLVNLKIRDCFNLQEEAKESKQLNYKLISILLGEYFLIILKIKVKGLF